MPRILRSQTRKMVFNVLQYMTKEAEEGLLYDRKAIRKRTAAATGVSRRTLHRIVAEVNNPNMVSVFRTPGKKRIVKSRLTGVDSFNKGVIKRCVHNFYNSENELPTVGQLLEKLKKDINFNGSRTSLRNILKRLGFKWKRTEEKRKVIIEHTNIRLQRIEYLDKITKYRAEGRPIIYTGELYIDPARSNTMYEIDSMKKKYMSKGMEIVLAGSKDGYLANTLLTLKAGAKSGDYYDSMNTENYQKWICSKLLPNLPPNSVIVVDISCYHSKLEDPAPTSNSKRSEMESWLYEKGIPFSATMLKPQLYKLICLKKDWSKKFHIDCILKANSHTVLRLPPCHPDLNPIELVCATIQDYVAKNNVTCNIEVAKNLVEEKVNAMGANEWSEFCQRVISIEEEYKTSDVLIDRLTEEINVRVDENESDSDFEESSASEKEECSSSSSSDEEVPAMSNELVFIEVPALK